MSNIFLTGCKNSSSYIGIHLCCFYIKLFYVSKLKMINGKKKKENVPNWSFNFGLVHRLNIKTITCFETQINLYHLSMIRTNIYHCNIISIPRESL